MNDIKVMIGIKKSMEAIASEMCEKYCKFPEQYLPGEFDDEDERTALLVEDHCQYCPLVQFLA